MYAFKSAFGKTQTGSDDLNVLPLAELHAAPHNMDTKPE